MSLVSATRRAFATDPAAVGSPGAPGTQVHALADGHVPADGHAPRDEVIWSAAIDSLITQLAVLDERGEIIAVNRAWLQFADERAIGDRGVGVNYLEVCDASDNPATARVAAGLREILAGRRDHFSLEYPRPVGAEERWFVMRATRHAAGERIHVVISFHDVSERHESQRQLTLARDYLRAVTDSIGEGMFTLDVDGRLTYINQAAQDQLGWSMDELSNRLMHDVTHSRESDGGPPASVENPIFRAYHDGVATRVDDDVFICRDGTELPVAYTAAPFATQDGVDGCVVVFRDITARKAEAARVERELDKLEWVKHIRDALARDRFELYAQPIVDLRTGRVTQRELLLRMLDPHAPDGSGKVIAPGAFLPVAEEYGFITDIDRWVLDRAAHLAATGLDVEVNVSAASISDPKLIEHIERALRRTGADPRRMLFEITETALMADEQAARSFVLALHTLGCKLALDDFGTGYGGFTYLKQLPIDTLKIDIEFVRDLVQNEASRKVVEAIVKLAGSFDLKTVAEGVEDEETLGLLREMDVDFAQGYHIARPAPLELGERPEHRGGLS